VTDVTLNDTIVAICDWHGKVVWISEHSNPITSVGDFAWQHLTGEHFELGKTAFSRVVTLQQDSKLEWKHDNGDHYRSWLWPLHSPEHAVCVLSIVVPKELFLLTNREREVLGFLSQGYGSAEIAAVLDISVSTVHTHLRRSRQKLELPNVESLTGFAARYCHPKTAQTVTKQDPAKE